MTEYIGYKDPIGNGQCNYGLTGDEIVRCRDCKHSAVLRSGRVCELRNPILFCTKNDNYCSRGVRRDD